jgi:hypothetical protein
MGRVNERLFWEKKESLNVIKAWKIKGHADLYIAENLMGINRNTLYRWKKESKKIRDALEFSKEYADAEVEFTLFKLATEGWETVTEIQEIRDNKKYIKRTIKREAPSIAAIIFYLKNRKKADWKDNPIDDEFDSNIQITLNWDRHKAA